MSNFLTSAVNGFLSIFKPTSASAAASKSTPVQVSSENDASAKAGKETEEDNMVEVALDYAERGERVTKETMKADNFGDWLKKQCYVGNNIIANGFDFDKVDDLNESWDELKANKEMGAKNIESNLSAEEQKAMREYAITLIEDRLNENKANIPDYGDCKDYYNEGSVTDWIIPGGHPAAFALKHFWKEGYDAISIGENGNLSLLNAISHIEDEFAGTEENGVRKDNYTDILGDFKSVGNIETDIANKEALLAQLKENVDNPEEFAKLYYQATDGMNFSADKVKEYKEATEKNEDAIPLNNVIGRNYISEDIGKNELGTNIEFEVNKTVGTALCKMIPAAGPLVAFATNFGVTMLEEGTKENSELDWDKTKEIAVSEGLRTFSVMKGGDIANFFKGKGWSSMAAKGTTKAALTDASSVIKSVDNYSAKDWAWVGAETLLNPATIVENGIKIGLGFFVK